MAVQGQHKPGVVRSTAPAVVLVRIDLRRVLSVFQQRAHPLAVFVEVQEGEVQRLGPADEKEY